MGSVLVLPLTDARKRRLPTHVLLRDYASSTQRKDARVTCEHAWSVDAGRVEVGSARPLTPDERAEVARALRLTLGLIELQPPPRRPAEPRGSRVEVDFGRGHPSEATGVRQAIVLSNDVGNYFGRTLLVAPVHPDDAEPADLSRLRVVDRERLSGPAAGRLSEEALGNVDQALEARIAGLEA